MPNAPGSLWTRVIAGLRRYRWVLAAALAVSRSPRPSNCGWAASRSDPTAGSAVGRHIWSSEQSQRFADPYTFSHTIHGMVFYAFLWLVARAPPCAHASSGARARSRVGDPRELPHHHQPLPRSHHRARLRRRQRLQLGERHRLRGPRIPVRLARPSLGDRRCHPRDGDRHARCWCATT